jgi:hemoglobin/transferrin/lactoferrin receptor protein
LRVKAHGVSARSEGHLVDLFASYAYSERVSANFSVNNLLNREYTQFLNIEPNPGLTVKGGITIEFAEK